MKNKNNKQLFKGFLFSKYLFSPFKKKILAQTVETFYNKVARDIEDDFMPTENKIGPIENNFRPIENKIGPIENNFRPIENNFMPIKNKIKPTENNFRLIEKDWAY